MPHARFLCKTGELAGTEHRIGVEATIGRDPGNTIVLPAGVVSKRHARIVFDPEAHTYTVEDLRSRNGTRLDGRPVENRVRLGELHVITIGERHDFVFVALPGRGGGATADARSSDSRSQAAMEPSPAQVGRSTDAGGRAGAAETHFEAPSTLRAPPLAGTTRDRAKSAADLPLEPATALDSPSVVAAPPLADAASEPGADSPAPATVLEPATLLPAPPMAGMSAPPPASTPGVAMVLALPDGARRRVELPDGRHIVGRGRSCPIRIDDRGLSREHAAFIVRAGAVTVEDLDSLNGTVLDGRPVRTAAPLPPGRPVTFGDRVTAVVIAADHATTENKSHA